MDGMAAKVTTVMWDSLDLDETVHFWATLLGLEEVHRTERYVYLSPVSDGGPHLAFQLVPEPRPGKNRLHLDIRVPDREAAEQKIVAAGGQVLSRVEEPGFPAWTVMADPGGNEFCIYTAPDNPGQG